jgi:hypothetical protein
LILMNPLGPGEHKQQIEQALAGKGFFAGHPVRVTA